MHNTVFNHPLEERMANILDHEGLWRWRYEVPYDVPYNYKTKDGKVRYAIKERRVDFVLSHGIYVKRPPKFVERHIYGPIDELVKNIEVKTRTESDKGHKNGNAMKQKKDLFKAGIDTLIVTEDMIDWYEVHGFKLEL
jgi:hypothetical protein